MLVTTKSDALNLEGRLTSATAVDLDFELRTVDGQVLMRSAGATATEFVSAAVQPNTTYVFRVLGFANGPSTFQIVSNQLLPQGSANENGGTRTVGGSSTCFGDEECNHAFGPVHSESADQNRFGTSTLTSLEHSSPARKAAPMWAAFFGDHSGYSQYRER